MALAETSTCITVITASRGPLHGKLPPLSKNRFIVISMEDVGLGGPEASRDCQAENRGWGCKPSCSSSSSSLC